MYKRQLRFLIPLALDGKKRTFIGQGRLFQRPMGGYDKMFIRNQVSIKLAKDSLTLQGELQSGEYALPGNISSQFISGLLYALPLLMDDSGIHLTTEIESKPYIELTREVQEPVSYTHLDVYKRQLQGSFSRNNRRTYCLYPHRL